MLTPSAAKGYSSGAKPQLQQHIQTYRLGVHLPVTHDTKQSLNRNNTQLHPHMSYVGRPPRSKKTPRMGSL